MHSRYSPIVIARSFGVYNFFLTKTSSMLDVFAEPMSARGTRSSPSRESVTSGGSVSVIKKYRKLLIRYRPRLT